MTLAVARSDTTTPSPKSGLPSAGSHDAGDEVTAAIAGVRQCAWALLVVWAIASVAANGVHAWLVQPADAPLPPLAAAGFGVLAPLALLGITELIARLLRLAQQMRDSTRIVYISLGLAILGAVGIAAAAFRLSFEALAEFGVMCGVSPALAWLVPCVIDGAILTADVAVVAASTAARLGPSAIAGETMETVQATADDAVVDETATIAIEVPHMDSVSLLKPLPTRPGLETGSAPRSVEFTAEAASAPRQLATPPVVSHEAAQPMAKPTTTAVPAVRPSVRPRVGRHHREESQRRPRVQLVMPQPSVAAVGE